MLASLPADAVLVGVEKGGTLHAHSAMEKPDVFVVSGNLLSSTTKMSSGRY